MAVRKKINGEWVELQEQVTMIGSKVISVYSVTDTANSTDSPVDKTTLHKVTAFGGDEDD